MNITTREVAALDSLRHAVRCNLNDDDLLMALRAAIVVLVPNDVIAWTTHAELARIADGYSATIWCANDRLDRDVPLYRGV